MRLYDLPAWAPWVLTLAVVILASILMLASPNKWDHATVLRICRDGTPILQLEDGTVWARRNALTRYRVKDPAMVC